MSFDAFSPGTILVLVVSLALLPYLAVMITSFTKLVVVFSLLRSALGLQQTPPNMVINGLAMIVSLYVMYPVGLQMADKARAKIEAHEPAVSSVPRSSFGFGQPERQRAPSSQGSASDEQNLNFLLDIANEIKEPMRAFLVKHTAEVEREFFLATARKNLPLEQQSSLSAEDLMIVIPAFTVSELTRAFQIGFLIFLPFLVIDLIVANILQALGMMMLSPTIISLPFKLLLFVLVDGWSKLIHSLVLSY